MTENNEWKLKVQDFLELCQDKVKQTTQIGAKMLCASKTNTCLNKCYEELGELVFESLKNGDLKWENPKAIELSDKIKQCIIDLSDIEKEVSEIKKANSEENM